MENIAELQKQYDELTAQRKNIKAKIEQKQKEEQAERDKKLLEEKNARKQEVDAARKAYIKLLNKYMEDYGAYAVIDEDPFFFKNLNWVL